MYFKSIFYVLSDCVINNLIFGRDLVILMNCARVPNFATATTVMAKLGTPVSAR